MGDEWADGHIPVFRQRLFVAFAQIILKIKERNRAMQTYFKQSPGNFFQEPMTKHRALFVMRILTLSLLITFLGLTHTTPTLAQAECQEVYDLMTFDYRSWGIGVHRNCLNCGFPPDPICIAKVPFCEAMKAKQIAFGEPVKLWIRASREAAL